MNLEIATESGDRGGSSSKPSVGVITALFDSFDHPPPLPSGFDQNLFVSDTQIVSEWKTYLLERPMHPRLVAKIPKMRPDLFLDTDVTVWIDASFREAHPGALRSIADQLTDGSEVALFRHRDRQTVRDEVAFSRNLWKYRNQELEEQLNHYQNSGFGDSAGLWACGLLVRRTSSQTKRLGNEWLAENFLWSFQDQVSFPFVLDQLGIAPQELPEQLWGKAFNWAAHLANDYYSPRRLWLVEMANRLWSPKYRPRLSWARKPHEGRAD